jgi:hypothetical protein
LFWCLPITEEDFREYHSGLMRELKAFASVKIVAFCAVAILMILAFEIVVP